MNNLNSILLEGILTRDPDLRYTPAGTAVCDLVVSTVRNYKLNNERAEEVSFIEATTHGQLATVCAEHLSKGRGVRLVGRIKQERWEDAYGNTQSKVLIVCEHVEFKPRRTGEVERRATVDANDRARRAGKEDYATARRAS